MPLDLSRFLRSRNPDDPRVRAARTRDVDRTIELCRALLTERGEVSGARVAAEVLGAYQRLSEEEVEWFFDRLVTAFSVDAETVRQAAAAYRLDASPANLLALQEAVEPPRQELFRRCNMAPGGTAVLVEMRRRLLRTLGDHPHRAEIDADLTHLFRSWFNRGFLTLARIDWQTSAVVLERLIQYEAVHRADRRPQTSSDLHRAARTGSPAHAVARLFRRVQPGTAFDEARHAGPSAAGVAAPQSGRGRAVSGLMSDVDHTNALAAEYVLGTLDSEEREQARAMLDADTAFAGKVVQWERRLGELHLMVEPVEPDAQIGRASNPRCPKPSPDRMPGFRRRISRSPRLLPYRPRRRVWMPSKPPYRRPPQS